MRGKVEVIQIIEDGREKVLYEESNLVVDQGGQTIVDMLTTPATVFDTNPRVMDTSNWVVQAISFGKDASAYHRNAHKVVNKNLLPYSSPSALYKINGVGMQGVSSINMPASEANVTWRVCSAPDVDPPAIFSGVASSIAHVTEVVNLNPSSPKGSIRCVNTGCNRVLVYNLVEKTHPYGGSSRYSTSGPQDIWLCASLYFKVATDKYPLFFGASTLALTPYGKTRTVLPKLSVRGVGYDHSTHEGAQSYGNAKGATQPTINPKTGEVSSMAFAWKKEKSRSPSAGFAISGWEPGGGIEKLDNGWYRSWTSILTCSGVSAVQMIMYPVISNYFDSSGGVYIYGCQLEVGKFPTELQHKNDGIMPTNWDFSGNMMAMGRNITPEWRNALGTAQPSGGPSGTGGVVRVSGIAGVSSYYPQGPSGLEATLPSYPSPMDDKLERGDTRPGFEVSSPVRGFGVGQNLNVIPYRYNLSSIGWVSGGFTLGTTHLNQENNFDLWWAWRNITYNFPVNRIGPNAYYLGCYPEGSSTGGTNWSIGVDVDTSTSYYPYSGQIASGTYYGGFNEASSMDVSGYVGKVYNPIVGTTWGGGHKGNVGLPADNSFSAYGLVVSSPAFSTNNFVDNTKVVYETTIFSGDAGLANLYGGIYNMGLWTLDVKESLKRAVPPFIFKPLFNPRQYRLFSSKKFVNNLTFIQDAVGPSTGNMEAGALNYQHLKIRWTIDFNPAEEQ